MTYQEAAQTALDVQDAVNLSGVVHSFSQAVTAIWDEAHAKQNGTEWVNEHPIVTMFLDKLNQLNRYSYHESFSQYYETVSGIARRE